MSMFDNLFKGGSDKGKKDKKTKAKAKTSTAKSVKSTKPVKPVAPRTQKAAEVVSKPVVPKEAPAPENPMDLDEMLSNILKIEDILGHGEKGAESAGAASERYFSIYLMLKDMIRIMPTAFTDTEDLSNSEEICEVVIEDLFDKLSAGKVETTLGYFMSSVPQHFLATDLDRASNLPVLLPLPLIVDAIGPEELRKRTSVVKEEPVDIDLPDLFGAKGLKIPENEPAPPPAPPAPPAAPKPPVAAPPAPPAAPKPPVAAPPAPPVAPKAPPPVPPKPPAPVPPVAAPVPQKAPPVALKKDVPPADEPLALKSEQASVPPAAPPPVKAQEEAAKPSSLRLKSKGSAEPLTTKAAPAPKTEIKEAALAPLKAKIAEEPVVAPQPPKPVAEKPTKAKAPVKPKKAVKAKKAESTKLKSVKKAPAPSAPTPAPEKPVVKAPAPPAPVPVPAKPVAKAPAPPAPAPVPEKPVAKAPAPPAPAPVPEKPVAKAPAPPAPAPVPEKPVAKAPAPLAPAPVPEKPVVKAPAPPAPAPVPEKPVVIAPAPAPVPEKPVIKEVLPKASEPAKPIAASRDAKNVSPLVVQGVDVNKASVEELLRIEGMGQYMAQRLEEERRLNGCFFDLCDLARVAGIEYNVFEQITGMAWSEELYREMRTANKVLGSVEDGMPDVEQVALRFKLLDGFEGCIITHSDGDLLASSWDPNASDTLKAMGPQIIKRVKRYMDEIGIGETLSVVIVMEGRSVSVIQVADICFLGVHAVDGRSHKNLQIVQSVGMSLGHRFATVPGVR